VREDPSATGPIVLRSATATREDRSVTARSEDLHPIVPHMGREDPTVTGTSVLHSEIVMIEDLHPIVPPMVREDLSATGLIVLHSAGKTALRSPHHVMRPVRKAG